MHTDESVNAYITGGLLAGEKYHYDPQDRHGPALYILAKPVAQLGGAKSFTELTESQLRLSTVLAGTFTVLLLGAGVEMFGFIPLPRRRAAVRLRAAAGLLQPLFHPRNLVRRGDARPDSFRRNSLLSAALAGFCAALMLACKETAVIHYFALGLAAASAGIFKRREKFLHSKYGWLPRSLSSPPQFCCSPGVVKIGRNG